MIQHRKDLFKVLEHFNLKGEIAEVGVAEGNNSELMATWDCVTKVWMIDTWSTIDGQKGDGSNPQEWHSDNYMKCMNIAFHNVKCYISPGMSIDVAKIVPDESLIMVYLDANHSYEAVIDDLNAWFPKIVSGGIISGHDFMNDEYGVKRAVNEFCSGRFKINIIPETQDCDASFWFIKI